MAGVATEKPGHSILSGVFVATESYWLEVRPQHYLFVLRRSVDTEKLWFQKAALNMSIESNSFLT